jgi:molecular chaperone DnaK (HSP70)
MASFAEQIQSYQSAFAEAQAKGDEAMSRKIKAQIQELEAFQQRHPEATEAPTPLEVFCDLNPSNINCRVYDD